MVKKEKDPFDQVKDQGRNIELHILENFHKALSNDSHRRTPDVPGVPHVSAITHECIRPMYYDMTMKFRPMDSKGAITTWVGRKVHETQILKNGQMELKLVWPGYLQGTIDELDETVLMDKKTTRNIPKRPYAVHIKQVELYRLLLVKNNLPTPEHNAILYINVDDGSVKPFVQKFAEDLALLDEEVLAKVTVLKQCLATRMLPPRVIEPVEDDIGKTQCDWCIWYNICWSQDIFDNNKERLQVVEASANGL